MSTISVRYHPAWPIVSLAAGGLFLLATILLFASGSGFHVGMLLAPLGIFTGVWELAKSYFEYDPTTMTVTVRPPIGWTRRFGGVNGGRLFITGNQIRCVLPNGRTKRVPVSALLAKRQDWHAVMATLNQQTAGGPAGR